MSKQAEALKLALVAERVLKAWDDPQGMPVLCEEMNCLREALAEQTAQKRPQNCGTGYCSCIECVMEPAQQQEPYGWKVYGVNSLFMGEFAEADAKAEAKRIGGTCITFPLYTSSPASKPWVGLTDEERNAILDREFKQWWSRHDAVCRAIEAKLREKNEWR